MKSNIDTLESMCELIVDCPHSTPKWTDTGLIVLRNQNIRNGRLDLSGPSYTDEDNFQKRIKRAKPQAGDIVFTREAPMGEVCMIPDGVRCCLGQRQVLLRPKKSVNGKYLFFALQSPVVQHEISWNEGTGSTVSNVRIPVLKNLNIPRHPGCEDQIAEILSSLTDKIELNRQINQTLEHITQAIFKSWFVDFEPVKAKVIAREKGGNELAQSLAAQAILCGALTLPQLQDMDAGYRGLEHKLHPLITERFPDQHGLDFWTPETLNQLAALFPDECEGSELGDIPKGWEIKPLSKMIELTGGGTPKRSEESYWGGDIPWFSVKDAPNDGDVFVIDTDEKITEAGLNKSSAKLLPEGVTIITARGTVGKLALVGVPMAMNQSCYGVKGANGIGSAFNYLNLKQALSTLKRQTHGAVFDTITTKTFDSVYAVEPCNNSIKIFEKMVEPLFEKVRNNLFENMNLVECRDSLLPKLLSGEITLGDTQSTAEAVA